MSDPGTGEDRPGRALLVAVVAMAGVALLVGLAIGGAALGVLKLTGVDGSDSTADEAEATLVMPRCRHTDDPDRDRDRADAGPSRSPKKKPRATPRSQPITLEATPQRVAPGGRIDLDGSYPAGNGVTLQVQRKEGDRWIDFPVTVTVQGGAFTTWVQTTRIGPSAFRVYDVAGQRGSNVAVVTVG